MFVFNFVCSFFDGFLLCMLSHVLLFSSGPLELALSARSRSYYDRRQPATLGLTPFLLL